ncbi:MAG: UvrD-helicase domain-containing protein [Lentisphaerae bacterium]|nr:UvrD-helicase domain-containing protein [Lentisphaerota bacterium]
MSELTGQIANLNSDFFSKTGIKRMHLIEASAGTGKTYTIQTLFLRLTLIEKLNVR